MKLSRILNEMRAPSWLDNVITTPYSDRDHWAAFEFNIPGPVDLFDGHTPGGMAIKIKDIVITPDFDALLDGHPMLPPDTSDNPLDNVRDEFDVDEIETPYQIEGYFNGRPFYGEFDYVETMDNHVRVGYSDLGNSDIKNSVFTGHQVFVNIIEKIAWTVVNKHYETHR